MISPLRRTRLPSFLTSVFRPYSTPPTAALERAKLNAAAAAVSACLRPHDRVIGIGSGSTVAAVVEVLKKDLEAQEGRWFVPTGWQSRQLIRDAGLRLGAIDQFKSIDVTFDGADDIDSLSNAIKGGGACLLQEKVLAEMSDNWVLVADWRKDSVALGEGHWKQGIPIEVTPMAAAHVLRQLVNTYGYTHAAVRMGGSAKAGPVVSDNNNFIVDAQFTPRRMLLPGDLLEELKRLTGVVEVGLFVDIYPEVFFGLEDGTFKRRRKTS